MTEPETAYRVLARKYRPETFADLIGQDAMVRTLRNAFEADRIAHAFVLTGVRGVGKTTTARIVAKGLNCIGKDGQGGPTIEPCGTCEACIAIAEGRHVDVLEMDAASRTGVGDIREIIDSVAYRAASARYKVYIIDEVHMLSTSAFNALLKTLEEPPEHVKFIFATTEIRKVPVTVLSRCQRFDLRRIEPEAMLTHLSGIAGKEGTTVSDDALALITRAADGSVRDALSLLDQAIAHGAGTVDAAEIRAMLGLADRGRVLDLFEQIMSGDVAAALAELSAQYAAGADPVAVLRDLAETTHWITMVSITPDAADDPTVGPGERTRGLDLAQRLSMRSLTRAWQMLLKILDETASAPNAMMAAEMAIIRLTHVADLPSPEEVVRRLSTDPGSAPDAPPATSPSPGPPASSPSAQAPSAPARAMAGRAPERRPTESPSVENAPDSQALARYASFEDVVALVRSRRDVSLLVQIENGVRLVSYTPGRIEFEPTDSAMPDLAQTLGKKLGLWTGARWAVSVVGHGGAPSLAEARASSQRDLKAQVSGHPLMQAVLAAFPGAEIRDVRLPGESTDGSTTAPGPEFESLGLEEDDDWDPFDPESAEE